MAHKLRRHREKLKRRGEIYSWGTSLICVAPKRLLPVGLNVCVSGEHKIVQEAKVRLLRKESEAEVMYHIKEELEYMELEDEYEFSGDELDNRAEIIFRLARIHCHLYKIEHPEDPKRAVWEKLMSKSRKKAVVSCFRMTPLYNMPPHKVINVLIKAYNNLWLQSEERDFASELISALTRPRNLQVCEAPVAVDDNETKILTDPLYQIIQVFKKHAVRTAANESIQTDQLYLHYAELMARSCGDACDDEDDEDEHTSFEEKETEKQHLLYCQERYFIATYWQLRSKTTC